MFYGPQTREGNELITSYFTDPLLAEVFKLEVKDQLGDPCLRLDVVQCQGQDVVP